MCCRRVCRPRIGDDLSDNGTAYCNGRRRGKQTSDLGCRLLQAGVSGPGCLSLFFKVASLKLRSWQSRGNAHRPLTSNRKRNRQQRLPWVHRRSTTSRAGKGKRRGGRTSTSKISRRNSSLFARKSAHSGAYIFFHPHHRWVLSYHSSTLQKKTDSELFVVDTKGDDKGMALLTFLTHHHITRSLLSPKVSPALLPRLPEVASNNHPAFCGPCSLCATSQVSRELPR
jgi:hypothetical protein